jgi:hypothetical protein
MIYLSKTKFMKISYNNTALSFLGNTKQFPFYIPEMHPKITDAQTLELDWLVREGYKNHVSNYKKNIQLITEPFYKAYHLAKPKLKDVIFKEVFEKAGTLILPHPQVTKTIFYAMETSIKNDKWEFDCILTMFTKRPKQDEFGLDLFYINIMNEEERTAAYKCFIYEGFVNDGMDGEYWISELLLLKTFLKYAELETKVVNAGKKILHNGEKVKNDTEQKVEILDSTYFTTISRTEGFGVSGHFRLQPYGPGLCERRLQWIPEFQKHGYTRKAKILTT